MLIKEIISDIIVCLFCLIIGIFIGLNLYSQYDANRDGKVTASDYVTIKNYIMNREENNE